MERAEAAIPFAVNAATKVPFSLARSSPLPVPPPRPLCSLGHLSDQFRARNGGFLEKDSDFDEGGGT